jgi:hypothetical protein
MKVEHLPLVVALVAATASVTGVAYTQYGAVRLERQKWEQSQTELKQKALVEAVINFARDLGAANQRAELITWTAVNDPDSLNSQSFLEYDRNSISALSSIAAHRIIVAAQNPDVASHTENAANAYYFVDECISKASVTFRTSRQHGLAELAACKEQAFKASQLMLKEFRDVLVGQQSDTSQR